MAPLSPRDRHALYALAVVLFAMDRVYKALALAGAAFGTPGALEFSLFRNHGIAFSLPLPALLYWLVVPALLIALVALFVRLHRTGDAKAPFALLVIAGALSNLLDRAAHGAVIDYLIFFGRSAVNVADGMVIAGLLGLVRTPRTPAAAPAAQPSAR